VTFRIRPKAMVSVKLLMAGSIRLTIVKLMPNFITSFKNTLVLV
jgi:hypothetical protein